MRIVAQGNRNGGPTDSVDRLLAGWRAAQPDLDLSPVAVIARLDRLSRTISAELEATFAQYGLNGAEFATLVTLRRLDQPTGVSQRPLMRELNLSSGTVSVRVERLAERGLVSREVDPADRRNSRIALTDKGIALFERVTPAHVATENRLLAGLDAAERDQLVGTLRNLLVSMEGSTQQGPYPRLGLTLAPAHITMATRRAAGLPETVGLLVRDVDEAGRAAAAGIRVGDVLVAAGRTELRSITALYAAISRAIPAKSLVLQAIRGEKSTVDVELDLHPLPADELPPGNVAPPSRSAAHEL